MLRNRKIESDPIWCFVAQSHVPVRNLRASDAQLGCGIPWGKPTENRMAIPTRLKMEYEGGA